MKRKSLIVCLHKHFAARQTEAYQLERTEQEKEELLQKLQLQCEESKHENVRLAERNKKSEDLISRHRSDIWELKLKQRKMKLKFENELHSMMQQHKQLYADIVSRHLLPPPPRHKQLPTCIWSSHPERRSAKRVKRSTDSRTRDVSSSDDVHLKDCLGTFMEKAGHFAPLS
ncbi:synaptonemal complex central element protein 1 isoform X2 [Syngnathus acus]|nr:synaptonemal complex central element protein 1 isoform X2 [Syngnathus acus]